MDCYSCNHHMFSTDAGSIRYCLNTSCELYLVEFKRIKDIIYENAEDFYEDDWNPSEFEDDF